jgi:hypothetical protein
LPTNLPAQRLTDLRVSRHWRRLLRRRIVVDVMIAAGARENAAESVEFLEEGLPLHAGMAMGFICAPGDELRARRSSAMS